MNNDLISREALKDVLNEKFKNSRTLGFHTFCLICDAIDNAPTVEERPQGKWGKHGECPFCSYIKQWEDDKFCGNCGAKLGKGGAE